MSPDRAILLLAILAALALPAAAQVFKWVDEKGRTHYGEKPPEGAKASELGVTPPPSGATVPTPDWKQKELDAKRQKIDRESKDATAESRAKRREAERAQRCSEARRRLAILEEQRRVFDRNAKGERVYLDDKDRPAAIATEKREIAENC